MTIASAFQKTANSSAIKKLLSWLSVEFIKYSLVSVQKMKWLSRAQKLGGNL